MLLKRKNDNQPRIVLVNHKLFIKSGNRVRIIFHSFNQDLLGAQTGTI